MSIPTCITGELHVWLWALIGQWWAAMIWSTFLQIISLVWNGPWNCALDKICVPFDDLLASSIIFPPESFFFFTIGLGESPSSLYLNKSGMKVERKHQPLRWYFPPWWPFDTSAIILPNSIQSNMISLPPPPPLSSNMLAFPSSLNSFFLHSTFLHEPVLFFFSFLNSWINFTWPLRKQAAYKQATRGPTALSPFRGTRQWG